jgi:F0F1-type ATP synthase assembly protein I
VAFVASSFLAAFLIVLLVLGIALAYVRIRRGEELVEAPELAAEEEPTLTPS